MTKPIGNMETINYKWNKFQMGEKKRKERIEKEKEEENCAENQQSAQMYGYCCRQHAVDQGVLGFLGETANKYDVFTDDGGEKYKVIESSDYCLMPCCCKGLQLHVFQPEASKDQEVMMFDRPYKYGQCCACLGIQCCACLDICRQEMTVYVSGCVRTVMRPRLRTRRTRLLGPVVLPLGRT
jgi:hypothetical protein